MTNIFIDAHDPLRTSIPSMVQNDGELPFDHDEQEGDSGACYLRDSRNLHCLFVRTYNCSSSRDCVPIQVAVELCYDRLLTFPFLPV